MVRGEFVAIVGLGPGPPTNQLHVPTRQVVEDERLDLAVRSMQAVRREFRIDRRLDALESGEEPSIFWAQVAGEGGEVRQGRIETVEGHVGRREPEDVP